MPLATPRLDHVVVDVRGAMDEAVRVYRSLGFQLTERGHHSAGSINHLAVFDADYLELLGFDEKAGAVRADIASFPVGLNGLVFASEESDSLWSDLRARSVPAQEPAALSRPVNLGEKTADARFRVVRLPAGTASFGRVYFCEHLTRELVWRNEWRRHPNGALAIAGILIAACDPVASSRIFCQMFGTDAVRPGPDGAWTLAAGAVHVELMPMEHLTRRLGDAMPNPAGRADFMAALRIRTRSLAQVARALEASGIRSARIESQRILVPAADAMNVALEFVA